MGAKSKQAIEQAGAAIAAILAAANSLAENYKQLQQARSASIDAKLALANYITNNKGGSDLALRARTDPQIAEKYHAVLAGRADVERICRLCADDHERGVTAVNQLIAAKQKLVDLINAKQRVRNQKTGNIIKKIGNLVKTKSLGDLKAEYARLDKAFEATKLAMMGINSKDYLP